MTAITEELGTPETDSDAADTVAQSVDGFAADATQADSALVDLPSGSENGSVDSGETFLKVVKGSPSPEEVAALVAVLSAMAASGSTDPASNLPPENWGAPTSMHRVRIPFSPYSFTSVPALRP
ncbi:hypothetical protein BFN03_04375 [Rhodococcus sp. WMMA185]|uniref:acyl-CoA carboxylase subunit epsilon n=1 Tax=Rhodococcus sp. WMMA185 TaxID=679318 RepID=UPI000878A3E0|nr:acyl-CoA carboxylase subunit epsilon [Rhodococcus sp. WMMA185]AOW92204.1 hypothetical protein BFN03_04375 [Rhodococcus sp. WMMA185]